MIVWVANLIRNKQAVGPYVRQAPGNCARTVET